MRKSSGNKLESRSDRIMEAVIAVFLSIIGFLMLFPMLNVLALSLSSGDAVNIGGLHILPQEFSLEGYRFVFQSPYIWTGYYNTIIRTVANTFLGLLVTICFAYPLSKKDLPGRKLFTIIVVITMFASGGLIPEYLLVRSLGLLNSRWSLIIPGLCKAFNIIIVRNFFMAIPDELEEAAEIDGANELQTLFSVILPVSKPIIATIGLWIIVDQWNKWFDCLLYIQDPAKYVLQVVLRRVIYDSSVQMTGTSLVKQALLSQEVVKYATIVVATLPILMIYPFIQKYFVKGVMVGSLKG